MFMTIVRAVHAPDHYRSVGKRGIEKIDDRAKNNSFFKRSSAAHNAFHANAPEHGMFE
jgi:hypothetical protein